MTGNEAIDLFNSRYEFMASQNAPGFTDDEILDLINEAVYEFISQKAFGNNLYRTGFEHSAKRVDDLERLIKDENVTTNITSHSVFVNVRLITLPTDFLYHVETYSTLDSDKNFAADLIMHKDIKNLIRTEVNIPWIEQPKVFIEDRKLNLIFDDTDYTNVSSVLLTYIKTPDVIVASNVDIVDFSDSAMREIVRLAYYNATVDGVPNKVQLSNDQLNKSE